MIRNHCTLRIAAPLAALILALVPASPSAADGKKRIAFVAGPDSHGHGAHEHTAGCRVLAKALEDSGLPVETVVHTGGWPSDPKFFDGADTIVLYMDGGRRHPVNKHLEQVEALMKKGVGLACLHYAVEVEAGTIEAGKGGDAFLRWIGGYFEINHSVNPHWVAKFEELSKHPITRGVKPFTINDEWYYSMRFPKDMENVTPILTAVPPDSTRKRRFGAHSGNPYVRSRLGQPEHVAWALQRPDGGRGFGFTGGHFHWNWGHADFRTTALNAIIWTAHLEVPKEGVSSRSPTREELEAFIPKKKARPQKKRADRKAKRPKQPREKAKQPSKAK